jgi:type IV secretion system protein VirB8
MSRDPVVEQYLEEAAGWDRDRMLEARRRATILGWVAFGGWACALAGSFALVALMPLKRVEPYVVRVDNSTGIVDVVPTFAGTAQFPESVTRYFLDHYVTVCERFGLSTAESDYEECGAFHSAARNQLWYQAWNPSNPASPLNTYKDGTSIRSQVSAVSFFARANGVKDLAQVRYVRTKHLAGGTEETTHHIATIQYAFSQPAKDAKSRRWNPLGFKIVEFTTEPEVLSDAPKVADVPRSTP